MTTFDDRYTSHPSVFFATFLLILYPLISSESNTTSVEFATKLYLHGKSAFPHFD